MNKFNNPIANAVFGSCVKKGKVSLSGSVFTSNSLTSLHKASQRHNKLTVSSGYAHTENMNQGSFGFSGSYGFKFIEKVDVSVSGYVGNAKSTTDNEMSIDYFSMVLAGLETLDINSLTINDLKDRLCLGAQQSLTNVIDAYNLLPDISADIEIDKIPFTDPKLYENWANAKQDFFRNYGESFVAAIKWGAVGGARLNMKGTTQTSNWKYGAKTDFQYSNVEASFNVQAAYDGSQTAGKSNLTGTVDEILLGDALKISVDAMVENLNTQLTSNATKTFDGNIKFPDLTIIPVTTKAPTWITEEREGLKKKAEEKAASEKLAKSAADSKLEKLKPNLALAALKNRTISEKISANKKDYLKLTDILNPKKNPLLTIASVKSLMNNVTGFKSSLFKNSVESDNLSNSSSNIDKPISMESDEPSKSESPSISESMSGNYTPLGLWLVNWADLFPWLAEINDNGLEGNEQVQIRATWRAMIQDFKTINIIYNAAQAANIRFDEKDDPFHAQKIAGQFRTQLDILCNCKLDNLQKAMSDAYNGLGRQNKVIYDKWCEVGFLRNAELGLGIVFEHKDHTRYSPTNDDKIIYYPIDFQPGDTPSVFSANKKVLPIIFPDGTIKAFCNEGILTYFKRTLVSANGGYGQNGGYWDDPNPMLPEKQILFIPSGQKPNLPPQVKEGNYLIKYEYNDSFKADANGMCLENLEFKPIPPGVTGMSEANSTGSAISLNGKPTSGYFLIQLIPLPFSAASGGKWQGSAAGAQNFYNDENYKAQIETIELEMKSAPLLSVSPVLKAMNNDYLKTVLNNIPLHSFYWGIMPKDEDSNSLNTFWGDNS